MSINLNINICRQHFISNHSYSPREGSSPRTMLKRILRGHVPPSIRLSQDKTAESCRLHILEKTVLQLHLLTDSCQSFKAFLCKLWRDFHLQAGQSKGATPPRPAAQELGGTKTGLCALTVSFSHF